MDSLNPPILVKVGYLEEDPLQKGLYHRVYEIIECKDKQEVVKLLSNDKREVAKRGD